MPTIVGLAGSLRKGSFNEALLRAAIELAPSGTTVEHASIRGIPLYDGDAEAASGIPETVQKLKDKIAQSDGLLLVTPEYNGSTTGVLKQRFMVSTSSHARRYDMPSAFAAEVIDPVSAIAASRSTLPGPTAMSSPRVMRRRKFTSCVFAM